MNASALSSPAGIRTNSVPLTGTGALSGLAAHNAETFVQVYPDRKISMYTDWNRCDQVLLLAHVLTTEDNIGLLCFDGILIVESNFAFSEKVQCIRSFTNPAQILRSNKMPHSTLLSRATDGQLGSHHRCVVATHSPEGAP